MKRIILAALVATPLAAFALGPDKDFKDCSMKGSRTAKKTDLMTQATVKEAAAKKAAQDSVGGGSIVKGGIEVESGCLVYSYHVKDTAGKGQTEVFVDAGDGKILKKEHESAMRAAAEKPVDKTKELADKTKEATTGKPSTNQAMTNEKK